MGVKRMIRLGLLVVLLLLLSPETAIFAQGGKISDPQPFNEGDRALASPVMSYQGRLFEDGLPVNGTRQMIFRLYVLPDHLMWTSSPTSVSVSDGLFQVQLGPFDYSALSWMDNTLWLEVEVEGEIFPRQLLTGAPFAFTLAPGAEISGNMSGTLLKIDNSDGSAISGASVDNHGLNAFSQNDSAVYANSIYGAGIYSESNHGHGVIAISYDPDLGAAALFSHAISTDGVSIWSSSNSSQANTVLKNSGTGSMLEAFSGDADEFRPEFSIENDGTLMQDFSANGLVKVGAKIKCSDTTSLLLSSFSTVIDAPASITIDNSTSHGTGACVIDLGFDLAGRYWFAQCPTPTPTFANCAKISDTKLWCQIYGIDGSFPDGEIMLFVY